MSLPQAKQQKLVSLGLLLKATTYFEYEQIKKRYWTGEHLLDQIQKKALPIIEALYPGYELLFMFDRAINHLVYAMDKLQVANMNKSSGS